MFDHEGREVESVQDLNFRFYIQPTDNKRVIEISQILYGQYYTWDLCFWPEIKSFFVKQKQPNTQNHGQGTYSAMMDTVVRPKIAKIPLHFLARFVCTSPKVGIFKTKTLSGCPSVIQLNPKYNFGC